MRILISVLAMLVVGLLATQAKADLVDDLRSGRSDITAAPSRIFEVRGINRWHEELKSKSNYRAMAAQWYSPWGSFTIYGARSAEAAVKAAVSRCASSWGGKCAVYSVGDQVVVGFSKRKLAAAIAAYDRGNKKAVTASESSYGNNVYCRRLIGTVYQSKNCQPDERRITKAEYDRLKGKTVTASKSTNSYTHCRRSNSTVYRTARGGTCLASVQISKAEYDRLKGKTATASTSTGSSGKTVTARKSLLYCQNLKSGRATKRSDIPRCLGTERSITKAEYDRLKNKKTATASTSTGSSGKTVTARKSLLYCQNLKSGRATKRSDIPRCLGTERSITKAEYDRLKNKKTATVASKTPEPETAPELDVLDAPYVALKNANVRERPDVESTRVATLSKGSEVTALGMVKGKNWYLISRDGKKLGYVFGTLLGEPEAEPEISVAAVPEVIQAAAREIDYGRYHALVIGNNDYRDLQNLKTAVNDATVVADVLRRNYGFTVELLLNADRYKIVTALNNLRKNLTYGDNLLIYYAGHGMLEEATDIGYWLPVDAENDNNANWISNSAVTGLIGTIPSLHVLVVADSCYSGTLSRGVKVEQRIGVEQDEWLVRMAQKKSRTLMSSGGVEPVQDSGGSGHSVFARPFIEALKTNTKIVDTEALFQEFKRKVIWNAKQTPRYDIIREAGHDGGDFLFVPLQLASTTEAGTSMATTPVSESAAKTQQDSLFWESVKDSADAADFEAYLEQFPDGTFARLARSKIEKTKKTKVAHLTPTITPLDGQMVAARNASVRSGPGTSHDRLQTLDAGDEVSVTGRTEDGEWYRIALAGGRIGFVFKNLIEEKRAGPVVGKTFRDCPECPEMVVVPSGSFMMGSPESEKGHKSNEGPIHSVSVRQPFAIGKYEVTFAEWDACVSGGGCNGYRPDDRGWGRGNRPVIDLSWYDARSYTEWLSRKTGHSYRLPSEAEWEYAARAGTTTPYHFGDLISSSRANYNNYKGRTVPVGSYPANAFGLHDVHGNVWEWVEDCWNESYAGAPSDTNVWKAGNCGRRVVRGGSWNDTPGYVRSAFRYGYGFAYRNDYDFGFRISRTLP